MVLPAVFAISISRRFTYAAGLAAFVQVRSTLIGDLSLLRRLLFGFETLGL